MRTAGRLVHYNGWYLWYDPEHRLVRACETSGCTTSGDQVTFTYDGESRRTRITRRIGAGATTTINLLYGDEAVAAETNAAGTVTRTYLTDETGTILKVCDPDCTGSNPRYLVTWNGHGDAQALWRIETSGALTLAKSYTYSTWGVPTTTTHNGIANLGFRFLYVGRHGVQWDDFGTGLATHYMAARHYVPALGRFLQPDPSRLETNAYGYAENSPVSKADPQGRFWFAIVLVGVSVAVWVTPKLLAAARSRKVGPAATRVAIPRGPTTRAAMMPETTDSTMKRPMSA